MGHIGQFGHPRVSFGHFPGKGLWCPLGLEKIYEFKFASADIFNTGS